MRRAHVRFAVFRNDVPCSHKSVHEQDVILVSVSGGVQRELVVRLYGGALQVEIVDDLRHCALVSNNWV